MFKCLVQGEQDIWTSDTILSLITSMPGMSMSNFVQQMTWWLISSWNHSRARRFWNFDVSSWIWNSGHLQYLQCRSVLRFHDFHQLKLVYNYFVLWIWRMPLKLSSPLLLLISCTLLVHMTNRTCTIHVTCFSSTSLSLINWSHFFW